MNIGNGSQAFRDFVSVRQAAATSPARHRPSDAARTLHAVADGALWRPSGGQVLPDSALPHSAFLKELHREERRAERSKAPLSLVLYRIVDNSAQASQVVLQLVELIHSTMRVTDILGHVGTDTIAVLCPDTDAHGTKAFMQKIEAKATELQFAAVAATYPDNLFERLADDGKAAPAFQPFHASDAMGRQAHAYPLKRVLDIAGALLALALLGPFMIVVAAAIALTSRGPIIFKQTRVGAGGTPFTFYKFRSMATNADDRIHREFVAKLIEKGDSPGVAAGAQAATFKMKADPRITPLGRFIRKTSIDELPQFFNVLMGDMSLVGPRPPIPYEAARYQPWHLRRLMTLKPGLTGIWQVEGRSKVTFNEMVRMDLRYIRECSLLLDLKILLKTVVVVARGDGAD